MLWQAINSPDKTIVEQLSLLLNVPQQIAFLLVQRGITSFDQAKNPAAPLAGKLRKKHHAHSHVETLPK